MYDNKMCNQGTRISWENALIKILIANRRSAYITVCYRGRGAFQQNFRNLVTLTVDSSTIIRNQLGQNLSLADLSEGMEINVVFSPAIVSCIPPQARAYSITVVNKESSSDE